ncbi:organic cation transporter protein-like isoform X2 [Homarus americanus]|uniref:organic cation transporter protein-like isoform X2 n=1 Tax=Homarus americanus TaxID=6706 RepID=UPI001C47F1DC|nr:organic cation transporter protein-like isoform X2 [Homarus americanus]
MSEKEAKNDNTGDTNEEKGTVKEETTDKEELDRGMKNDNKERQAKEVEEGTGGGSSSSEMFQTILRHVGDYGKWQWRVGIITSFCGVFTAFHNLAAAFLCAIPDHWCEVPGLQHVNTTLDLRNISIPWEINTDGKAKYSSCSYYNRDWDALVASGALSGDTLPDLPTNVSTNTCHDWDYNHTVYKTTVVEEWDLVCDERYLTSVVQSTYMAGVLAGAVILSELSDKFGRRTIALLSSVGILVSSVCVTFTTHYVAFIILRFLVAAFGSGVFLPNFVILMEVVGPEGRTTMGMMYQGFFSIGFMVLPAIAYFVREWRYLQLYISVPSVILLLYYWWLPESPRWLIMQGRHQEAFEILKEAARVNGGSMPQKEEMDVLMAHVNKEKTQAKLTQTRVFKKVTQFFKSIITLLSTKNMRRRCLIIFFAWFVVSMVYYGLAFSGGNINASIYLIVFLSGVVEIPSYILVCWTLKKFGRRLNLCVLFLICGAACLLIMAVPKEHVWVNLSLATVGKFFNSSAFGVAYIYSAELVPTGVRNIAVGTSSMCARIGSALAPFIVDLMGEMHYTVPSTVFGLLSITAGLLALLLPETGKTRLPETVEEVEAMPR